MKQGEESFGIIMKEGEESVEIIMKEGKKEKMYRDYNDLYFFSTIFYSAPEGKKRGDERGEISHSSF